MSDSSRGVAQYRVIFEMVGRHPKHADYPLLPGDILAYDEEGTLCKHAPGLAIRGFVLSDDDLATRCERADDARWVLV